MFGIFRNYLYSIGPSMSPCLQLNSKNYSTRRKSPQYTLGSERLQYGIK